MLCAPRTLSLSLLLLLPGLVQEPEGPQDLGPLLEPLLERHELPGLACAAFDSSGLIGIGAAGRRSARADVEIGLDDQWHLGSCTKAMTATLVARLVEREVVDWDTSVGDVFGDLDGRLAPEWADVTLELLVSNRAGAPAQLNRTPLWLTLRMSREGGREQRRTLIADVLSRPPEVAPGSAYLYSNAGFCIAGAMLEERADASWEQLMSREVFEPLGMRSAGFGVPGRAGALDQPLGHRVQKERLIPVAITPLADNPPALGPAGRVHASLADWARFASAHLTRDEEFLSQQSWERLQSPLEGQHYGYGWGFYERPWAAGAAMHHSGTNTMWYCTVWMAPERGLGFLVATNVGGEGAREACDQVAGALVERHAKRPEEAR